MEQELKRVPCKAKIRECVGEHSCLITPELESVLVRVLEDARKWKTQGFPLSELIIRDEEELLVFQSVRKELSAKKALLVQDMMRHIVGDTLSDAVRSDIDLLPGVASDDEVGPPKKEKKKRHRLRRK